MSAPSSSFPPSSSSDPSSSRSQSSSTPSSPLKTPHNPLRPPIPMPATAPLAAELDPYAVHRKLYEEQNRPSAMPEKCFTFCSQRAEGAPLCRMFCLRKRPALGSQKDDIARLRPPKFRDAQGSGRVQGVQGLTGVVESRAGHEALARPAASMRRETDSTASSKTWFAGLTSWSPFEALKRRLDPYSIIYVRGTPEGVVGRYMEELEYDDGEHDFGAISRGADKATRRRGHDGWEYLDWGDHGAMLHLPLTTVFYPFISLPQTIKTVFGPTADLLGRYKDSWTDGTQRLNFKAFMDEVADGGALKTLKKLSTAGEEKWAEMMTQAKAQAEARRKAQIQANEKRQAELKALQGQREQLLGVGGPRADVKAPGRPREEHQRDISAAGGDNKEEA